MIGTQEYARTGRRRDRKDTDTKLLIVRYGRERCHDDPEQAPGFRQAAEKIGGVPGLVWKLWGYDDDQRVATSI